MNRITTETVLLALLALVLIALEIVSAYLAYETIGAVASTLYFLAIGINLVFLLVAIRKPMVAAVGMVLLALAIVPYQFALAQRLWRAQTEAARIVTFAYEQKLATGEYPTNLADYRYHDPEMKTYIQQFQGDADVGAFVLCYRVGTESTYHCHSPRDGWTYYPGLEEFFVVQWLDKTLEPRK